MKLSDSIQYVKGVGPKKKVELNRLGIKTVYDLLTYYPRTYEDQSVLTKIADLKAGCQSTVAGVIVNVSDRQGGRRGMTIITALIGDGSGFLQITWFNQKYLKKQLKPGSRVFVTGKVSYAYGGRGQFAMSQLASFQILGEADEAETLTGIMPVYGATEKLNQKFFRKIIKELFASELEVEEIIAEPIKVKYNLLNRFEALKNIHFPENFTELKIARARLAFEELYMIQCGLLLLKKRVQEKKSGVRHLADSNLLKQVLTALPFKLTHDQAKTWQEIKHDMESSVPMRRLVQGDVGSGKTVIALLALVKTVENGYQGALMAPTEILASQHYESFQKLLSDFGIRVGFLSGRLTKKKREEMYALLAEQKIDIVIGTHALIQEGVHFAKLGLVVTDEQHRFGIDQRAELEKKGELTPDVLVMTATPIPRTDRKSVV